MNAVEAVNFCGECDKFLCLSCSQEHNKEHRILFENHKESIKNNTNNWGGRGVSNEMMMYCESRGECVGLESTEPQQNGGLQYQIELVEELVSEWEKDVDRIKECRINFEKRLRCYEVEWVGVKEGLLGLKDRVRENYRNLVEVLISKEITDFEKLDAEISKIESKFDEGKDSMKSDIKSLDKDESEIQNKIGNLKLGKIEEFKSESLFILPKKQELADLNPTLSFQSLPTQAITKLDSCIRSQTTLISFSMHHQEPQMHGKYVLENERVLNVRVLSSNVRHDTRYVYVLLNSDDSIDVYSLSTLQLVQSLKCPIGFQPWHIICVDECFLESGVNRLVLIDGEQAVMDDISLGSNGWNLKEGNSGNVLITCDDNSLYSYDVRDRKMKSIVRPLVQEIFECCSMASNGFCMVVKVDSTCKVVKCEGGSIVKSFKFDFDNCNSLNPFYTHICARNGYIFLLEREKKVVCVLDEELELLSFFHVDSTGYIYDMHVDCDLSIHISIEDPKERLLIRKYSLE